MEPIACRNCGTLVEGNFCPQCGQKRQKRISITSLAKDIYDGFFDFESPFLKTFISLTISPGKVYRDYIDGARQRYFSPIRYSLWILTMLVATGTLLNIPTFEFISPENMPEEIKQDTVLYEEFLAFLDQFALLLNAAIIPITFVSSLWMALVARIAFFKQKRTIAELYIPLLLNASHFTVVMIIAMLLGIYQMIETKMVIAALSMIYMIWGLAEIYRPRSVMSYIKSILAVGIGNYIFASLVFYGAGFIGGLLSQL